MVVELDLAGAGADHTGQQLVDLGDHLRPDVGVDLASRPTTKNASARIGKNDRNPK